MFSLDSGLFKAALNGLVALIMASHSSICQRFGISPEFKMLLISSKKNYDTI
jgi:hypothetical protein